MPRVARRAFFCLFMLFLYGPIIVIGILSFQGPQGGLTFPLHEVSLHWFRDVFNPQYIGDFRFPFIRSLALGIIVMVLTTVISLAAGLAYRKRFVGAKGLFYLTIASLITPSLLVSLGIGLLFTRFEQQPHWLTSALGAHLTWTLPFGVLIMFAVFNRLDPALEEAARDQGASSWQALRHVVMPLVTPGLVGVALFGFTLSYDEFARTSMVSGEYNTLPAELVAVTTNNASPALYAVGALTTAFSFTVIASAFLGFYALQRRRAGRARRACTP